MTNGAFSRISWFGHEPPTRLTPEEFTEAFPGEGQHVEWKAGMGRRPIQEAIVAFSNAGGGILILGVDDRGCIVGCPLNEGLEKNLWEMVGQIESPGLVQISGMEVGRDRVTVVAVGQRYDGIAQTSNGRALVRRGKQNLPLLGRELRQLLNERLPGAFEASPSPWSIDDAAPELLGQLCLALGIDPSHSPAVLASALSQRGLAVAGDQTGILTFAGALYLVEAAQAAFGKCCIEVFRYGEGSREYDRREVFTGTPRQQVGDAVGWIIDEIGFDLMVVRTIRHELPRLPVDALREVLANAVAHRDYQLSGAAIEVHLMPRELVVVSPGGFAGGVTSDNIGEAHFARNPAVINVLRAFELAEDAGRGIDLVRYEMAAALRFEPRFEEAPEGWVRVVLPTVGPVTPEELAWTYEVGGEFEMHPGDRRVLAEALRGVELTNTAVRSMLDVGVSPARNTLQRLCEMGLLEHRGEGAGTRYRLASAVPAPRGRPLSREEMQAVVLGWGIDGPVTNSRVQEGFGVSRSVALGLLRNLVEQGRLVKSGTGRGAKYTLAEP
ncbi:MAG: putative DNA binding domain-containing protein [bacterium]|nr:putative DNA binding domain-containing protein [bacterium]MCY3961155.1 putative DNA binding domain-containing protein [bacterium]